MIQKHSITHIEIWEDREHHHKKFISHFEEMKKTNDIEFKVFKVDEVFTHLEANLEKELIDKLIERNKKGYKISKTVQYTAVRLDYQSKKKLIESYKPQIPKDWRIKCDHVTIQMGRVPKLFENFAVNLGDKIKLNITSLGKSEKAMAVQVSGVKTSNKFTHITLAISPEGRAVDSNFISKWEEEKNDLVLNGEVVEYTVDDLVNLNKQKKKQKNLNSKRN